MPSASTCMAFVDRFRYKASKARQAQSRLKMIAKLQPIALVADEEQGVNISLPAAGGTAAAAHHHRSCLGAAMSPASRS